MFSVQTLRYLNSLCCAEMLWDHAGCKSRMPTLAQSPMYYAFYIYGVSLTESQSSWCKLELQVANPFDTTPLTDQDPPPLTVMSISLRTVLNVKDNKQEIVAITARTYENISFDDPKPAATLPNRVFTVIRPSQKIFPPGFEAAAKKHPGNIKLEKTEGAVLNYFLAKLQLADPDAIIGHQLENVDYGLLLHRMREMKTNGWHRIGRLRRSEWPKTSGRMAGTFYSERTLAAGRLMCDLANDLGKVKSVERGWE